MDAWSFAMASRTNLRMSDEADPDVRLEMRRIVRMRWADLKYLAFHVAEDWFRHKVPRLGASLAFYTMLSLAPLLIVVLAVAGAVFGREAAAGQLVWQVSELVGPQGARLLESLIAAAADPLAGGIATIVGLITLFFGASAVVAELRDALNTIWDVPQSNAAFGWKSVLSVLKERTLAFAVVLAFGFLLLVSLAVNAALAAIGRRLNTALPVPDWALQSIDPILTFLVIGWMFALMFKYLPDIHIAWADVILGAVGTSLLFTAGKTLIGVYLGRASIGSTYGAAGSLVVVLLWVYYSAQIFFLGAEFTQAYADCFGSKPKERHRREKAVRRSVEPPPQVLEVPGEVRPAGRIEA